LTLARDDAADTRNRFLLDLSERRAELGDAELTQRHLQEKYVTAQATQRAKCSERDEFRRHYERMSQQDSTNLGSSTQRTLDRLSREVDTATHQVTVTFNPTRDQNVLIDRLKGAVETAAKRLAESDAELRRLDDELLEAQQPEAPR